MTYDAIKSILSCVYGLHNNGLQWYDPVAWYSILFIYDIILSVEIGIGGSIYLIPTISLNVELYSSGRFLSHFGAHAYRAKKSTTLCCAWNKLQLWISRKGNAARFSHSSHACINFGMKANELMCKIRSIYCDRDSNEISISFDWYIPNDIVGVSRCQRETNRTNVIKVRGRNKILVTKQKEREHNSKEKVRPGAPGRTVFSAPRAAPVMNSPSEIQCIGMIQKWKHI